jgi:hypothetical protein
MYTIEEFVHPGPVPGESEHSTSKNREPFKWAAKHKMAIFSKKAVTFLIKFQYLWRLSL